MSKPLSEVSKNSFLWSKLGFWILSALVAIFVGRVQRFEGDGLIFSLLPLGHSVRNTQLVLTLTCELLQHLNTCCGTPRGLMLWRKVAIQSRIIGVPRNRLGGGLNVSYTALERFQPIPLLLQDFAPVHLIRKQDKWRPAGQHTYSTVLVASPTNCKLENGWNAFMMWSC